MSLKEKVREKAIIEKEKAQAEELAGVNEQLSAVDVKINGLEDGIKKLQTAYEKVGVSGATFKKSYEELKKLFDDDADLEVKAALAEKGITSVEGLRKEEQDEDIVEDEEVKDYKESQSESKPLAKELKETKHSITEKFGIGFKQLGVESKKVSGGEKTLIEERVKAKFEHDKIAINEALDKMRAERQELYEKTPQGRKEKEEKFGQKIKESLKLRNLPVILRNPDYDRIVKGEEFDLAKEFGQGGEEFVKQKLKDEFGESIEAQINKEKEPLEQDLQTIEQLDSISRLRSEVFKSIDAGKGRRQAMSEELAKKWGLDEQSVTKTIDHIGLLTIGDFYSSSKNPLDLCETWLGMGEDKFNYSERGYLKNYLRDGEIRKILVEATKKEGKTDIPDYSKAKEFVDKYNKWLIDFQEVADKIEAPEKADDLYEGLRSERQGWEGEWPGGSNSIIYCTKPAVVLGPNVRQVLAQADKTAQSRVNFFDVSRNLLGKEIEGIENKGLGVKGLAESKIDFEFAQEGEYDYLKENRQAELVASQETSLERSKKASKELLAELLLASPRGEEGQMKVKLSFSDYGGGRYIIDFVDLTRKEQKFASEIEDKKKEVGVQDKSELEREQVKWEKKRTFLFFGKKKKQEALSMIADKLTTLTEIKELREGIEAKKQERHNQQEKLAQVLNGMVRCGDRADWQGLVGSEMSVEDIFRKANEKCQEISERRLTEEEQEVLGGYRKVKGLAEKAKQRYEKSKETVKGNT